MHFATFQTSYVKNSSENLLQSTVVLRTETINKSTISKWMLESWIKNSFRNAYTGQPLSSKVQKLEGMRIKSKGEFPLVSPSSTRFLLQTIAFLTSTSNACIFRWKNKIIGKIFFFLFCIFTSLTMQFHDTNHYLFDWINFRNFKQSLRSYLYVRDCFYLNRARY